VVTSKFIADAGLTIDARYPGLWLQVGIKGNEHVGCKMKS